MPKRIHAAALSAALALGLLACSETTPASAPEADVSAVSTTNRAPDPIRAAINRSLVGRWEGKVTSSRFPVAGSPIGTPFTLTFAVTSADELDAAYWGDDVGLNLITYIEPGTRSMRSWTPDGVLTETMPAVTDVMEPDIYDKWSFNRTVVQHFDDADAIELTTTFAHERNVLTATSKQRRAGSGEDYVENQTITFERFVPDGSN